MALLRRMLKSAFDVANDGCHTNEGFVVHQDPKRWIQIFGGVQYIPKLPRNLFNEEGEDLFPPCLSRSDIALYVMCRTLEPEDHVTWIIRNTNPLLETDNFPLP
jgi:hypothetical protein